MKKYIFISLLIFFSSSVFSQQDYKVPTDYKLESAEDYQALEPQILETVDWLLSTSLGKDAHKRQNANRFLIEWLTGTPNVSVEMRTEIVNFFEKNSELMIPFMAGWVKYSLENNYSKDALSGNKAGIEAVVSFYNKNRNYLQKDKNVEKYQKLIEKGNLEEYLNKILNKK